jgi:cysteine desulfurase
MTAPIYLDHAASTPVRQEVLEAMLPFLGVSFGNASSSHRWGRESRAALDEARERVANCLGAYADEVCFTSGGTEGDNLAVLGGWRVLKARGRRGVVTSPIEHKAVLQSVHQTAREGADERFIAVDATGTAELESAREQVRGDTALCSVIWVNNEIGTIQPIDALARHAHEHGALFHTDAVQAFGKVKVDAKATPFDLLTISGHKFGAPKGIGALFIRRSTPLEPLFFGGSQERGRRPGTENVAYAVGLARACELTLAEHAVESERLRALRDRLEAAILTKLPDARVHGRSAARAPHILNVSIPGTDSESMLMALDLKGIAASGGSACQSGSVNPSHVLQALGVPADIAGAAIRMSVGSLTTDEAIDRMIEVFPALALKARGLAAV